MNDTRKDGRLSVSLVARYREPSMLELREGECQDVSLNGMFIRTAKPSPRGALIRFECDAGRQEDNFRGTGRVVWQRRKADSRGPAGMGVRFVRLESGDHDALERIIRQLNENLSAAAQSARPASAANRRPDSAAESEEAGVANGGRPASSAADSARSGSPVADSARPGSAVADSARPGSPAADSARPGSAADSGRPADRQDRERMAKLAATLRGMPPTSDAVPDAASDRKADPRPQSDPARPQGFGGSSRPPMPTLLEVPRVVPPASPRPLNATPDLGATLLGAPPSAQANAVPGAGPAEAKARQPRVGSSTIFEAPARSDAVNKGRGGSERPDDDQRAGRAGKKRGRYDREPRSDSPSHGTDAHADAGADAQASRARPRGTAMALSDPGSEFPGRRRRYPPDEMEDRGTSEPPRRNSGTVMWLVLGTGLIVSWALVTLFGTVPVGLPDKVIDEPTPSNPPAGQRGEPGNTPGNAVKAPESVTPVPETRRYALYVETHPAGARIDVAGQSVVAPARVEFETIQPPLVVAAELAGYKPATVNVWPSEFEPKADRFEHRLVLEMQPEAPAAPAPAPPPREQVVRAPTRPSQPASPKPHKAEPPAPPAPSQPTIAASEATPAEPSPAAQTAAGESPAPSPQPAAGARQGGALAQALECLGRGDNRCVIRALENRASSARELELLIETYRAMSATPKAEAEMRRYLGIYPNGKRAAEYRRLLERRGAKL